MAASLAPLLLSLAGPLLADEPPNVVLFVADDLGTLDTRAYGSTDLQTPHLDRLARDGVRFTRFYAHTVCCPARALLLTGRHPQRGGVNRWTQNDAHASTGVHLHLGEVTLAEAFRGAGYRTGLFGKWHLGAALDHGPTRQGFDEFFGHRGGFIDNYNHFFLHGRGFHDLYRGTEEIFLRDEYFPDLTAEHAVQFVHTHHDTPFFLCVAFNLPHYPEQADPTFDEVHADLPAPRRSYARVVSTLDDRIGRVLAALDERSLTTRTVVAFLSDNGHSTERSQISVENHASGLPKGHDYGAHGGGGNTGPWRGAKGSFFEGGLRVPAILSYPPALPRGAVRDQAVQAGDLFPTLLELAGVALPQVELDGRSLLPLLRDAAAPSPHPELHWQWFDRWAVSVGDWKLIGGTDLAEDLLVHLAAEPPEREDQSDVRPELVRDLRARHEAWAAEVSPEAGRERLRRALEAADQPASPDLAVFTDLVPSRGRAYVEGETLYLQLRTPAARVSFPRLNNPMRRVRLLGGEELQLGQDSTRWWVDLPAGLRDEVHLALDLVGAPQVPHRPIVLGPDATGVVVLPAHQARVFGRKLCYEPQPHKNTLGYWVDVGDWAAWEFELAEPGPFEVTVLQGCGQGHGGSQVDVVVGDQRLELVVEDTGHFQNFVPRRLGSLELPAGRQRLELRPRVKAGGAVMDVREVRLEPVR